MPPDAQQLPLELYAVTFVVESSTVVAQQWRFVVEYTLHVLKRLLEGSKLQRTRMAYISYGAQDALPVPLISKRFFLDVNTMMKDFQHEMPKLETAYPNSSGKRGMAALDGFVAALEVFDQFRALQNPQNAASIKHNFFLVHVASSPPDASVTPTRNESPSFDRLTWDSLPSELKKREIHLSTINLGQSVPRFAKLHSVVASGTVPPWFAVHPPHVLLLDSFGLTPPQQPTPKSNALKRPNPPTTERPPEKKPRPQNTESPRIPPKTPKTPNAIPHQTPQPIHTPPHPPPQPQPQPTPHVQSQSQPQPQPQPQPQLHHLPPESQQHSQHAPQHAPQPSLPAPSHPQPPTMSQHNPVLAAVLSQLPPGTNPGAVLAMAARLDQTSTVMKAKLAQARAENKLEEAADAEMHLQKVLTQLQKLKPAVQELLRLRAMAANQNAQQNQDPQVHPGPSGTHLQRPQPPTPQQQQTPQPQTQLSSPQTIAGSPSLVHARSASGNFPPIASPITHTLSGPSSLSQPGQNHMKQMQKLVEQAHRLRPPAMGTSQSMPPTFGPGPSNSVAQPNPENSNPMGQPPMPPAAPTQAKNAHVWTGSLTVAGVPLPKEAFAIASSGTASKCHTDTWPTSLQLVPTTINFSMDVIKSYIARLAPAVVTFVAAPTAPEPKINEQMFAMVRHVLATRNVYATVQWTTPKGGQTKNAIFFPMGQGLVGLFFPLTGIPEMPSAPPSTGVPIPQAMALNIPMTPAIEAKLATVPPAQRAHALMQLRQIQLRQLQIQQQQQQQQQQHQQQQQQQQQQAMSQVDPNHMSFNPLIATGQNPMGVNMMPPGGGMGGGMGMGIAGFGGATNGGMPNPGGNPGLAPGINYEMFQSFMQRSNNLDMGQG